MRMTRRKFLVSAAAVALVGPAKHNNWEWRGSVMGAEARIILTGPRDEAQAALAEVVAEIDRLENIFSLNRPGSQLAHLNASGALAAPARDLRATLGAAAHWTRVTAGAFNPAIQPLWEHWSTSSERIAEAALERVRCAQVVATDEGITLSPGTALTLNGIAQGTVADRVAALLIRRGFCPPLIDTGEMRLPGPERREVILPEAHLTLRLAEVAVATSAPTALTFDHTGRRHHLFDPATGDSPDWWHSVTVIAPNAEMADALSTGFAVAAPEIVGDLAASLEGVAVIATSRSGGVSQFGETRLLTGAA